MCSSADAVDPLGLGVDTGESPLVVQGDEAVGDALEDGRRLLLGPPDLGPQLILPARGLAPDAGHLQMGPDPGQQLTGAEGLDEVVVRPGGQPFHPRLHARPGGEQDHGHGAGSRVGAKLLQEAEAVQPRHHHVRQHQVRRPIAGGGQGGPPVETASTW